MDDDILAAPDCNDEVIKRPKPTFELSTINLDESILSNSAIFLFFISFHNDPSFDDERDPLSFISSYDDTLIVRDDGKDMFLGIHYENSYVITERIQDDAYVF